MAGKAHTLYVRGVSKDVFHSLKRLAKKSNQSVNGFMLATISAATEGEISDEKLPTIKQAIEQVLNDDRESPFDTDKLYERYLELVKNTPVYTQEQMDKAIVDAFRAARERRLWDTSYDSYVYPNDEDYLKTINQKQTP